MRILFLSLGAGFGKGGGKGQIQAEVVRPEETPHAPARIVMGNKVLVPENVLEELLCSHRGALTTSRSSSLR